MFKIKGPEKNKGTARKKLTFIAVNRLSPIQYNNLLNSYIHTRLLGHKAPIFDFNCYCCFIAFSLLRLSNKQNFRGFIDFLVDFKN